VTLSGQTGDGTLSFPKIRVSWKTFLRNHAQAIAAIDLCVVPTLTFERLFAFLVLGHGRRQLLWFEVTRHPTAEWLARQITEAFPWTSEPAYLVRDNDGAYGGHVFTSRVRAMGIRDRPISPGSPCQNGCAERMIGTVRREGLDRLLIFSESHLRRVLAAYAAYYNEARTHLSLGKDAPLGWAVQRSGVIVAIELVWINVTSHPTAEWIAQQITEAFPWNELPRYLIRDQDGAYGTVVTRRLRAMGIRDKPIARGSPWQNAFADRLIGSIRREFIDHVVVLGEAHLRRLLQS
jgi:transposase InsO family protein